MKLKSTIILLLIVITVVACKKKAVEVNPDYIGNWNASTSEANYSLTISNDSQAEYYKNSGFTQVEATGKAKIKGDKLKIFTKKFTINQAPLQDTTYDYLGSYTMVLDDITYRAWK